MLSILDDGKLTNAEGGNTHDKASNLATDASYQDGFDDGIPRLPDIGWICDQGEVDPMERLSKVESAVFDASQQDLMSDL